MKRNIIILILLSLFAKSQAQDNPEKFLYRPQNHTNADTISKYPGVESDVNDAADMRTIFVRDSIETRLQFVRDSIEARMQFVRDSIAAREAFVRDSIARRERKLDSLNFLQRAVPGLLEASVKTISEEIVISLIDPVITDELTLTDFYYITLPFDYTRPYTPWKGVFNLSDKPIKIVVEGQNKRITSIQSPAFNFIFDYNQKLKTLRILEPGVIVKRPSGNLYKLPVDTVYYDASGRINKIKRYFEFYQVKNSYQKGTFLYTHLSQVRQFDYISGKLSGYQVTNFCDRDNAQQAKKVCNIITFGITTQNNLYIVKRHNEPANKYSDGTFTFEFTGDYVLKSTSFINDTKTENWKTYIEMNQEGYVGEYIYENKGVIANSLTINYFNDLKSKQKYETISCSYDHNGTCIYQKNNMTSKSRSRHEMTLEWSEWR